MSLASPHTWYPQARAMANRRVIAHVGPTNSGKTHAAIQSLLAAPSGSYCGPLRLLAQEQYDKTKVKGTGTGSDDVRMSLRTGESVMSWRQPDTTTPPLNNMRYNWKADGATHLSCTVEMADLKTTTMVSVLDEVQLMTDQERGWAFTQCLLGVPSETVYVCGEAAVVPLLERICRSMRTELQVKQFDRLSPLTLLSEPVTIDELQAGDAIISFSRHEIFALKTIIEHRLQRPHSCAIVYGALPPHHRVRQAAQFNESRVPFLLATDAVGLGLNLHIGRVLFTGFTKFTRQQGSHQEVEGRLVRQIGGRAGRFGGRFQQEGGKVGVLQIHDGDIGHRHALQLQRDLHRLWQKPVEPLKRAGLLPPDDHLLTACNHDSLLLESTLSQFNSMLAKGPYFYCRVDPLVNTLQAINKHLPGLDAETALLLAKAPIRHSRPPTVLLIESMACHLASCRPMNRYHLPTLLPSHSNNKLVSREERLGQAEEAYKALEVYKWVSMRFPHAFPACDSFDEYAETLRHIDTLFDQYIHYT